MQTTETTPAHDAILKDRIFDLRLTEIETRHELIELLKVFRAKTFWKSLGRKSLRDFCLQDLNFDPDELRSVLAKTGDITPAESLRSDDPSTQSRIDILRRWRSIESSRNGVAAFRVLSNRTLLETAKSYPKTREDLLKIAGIGERKANAFGEQILALLRHTH